VRRSRRLLSARMRAERVLTVDCRNGRRGRSFAHKTLKRERRKFQRGAILVGDHVRRARPIVKQRHVAEKIARPERRENRLFGIGIIRARNSPSMMKIHRVPGSPCSQPPPLRHAFQFHELRQMRKLRIVQARQIFMRRNEPGLMPADELPWRTPSPKSARETP